MIHRILVSKNEPNKFAVAYERILDMDEDTASDFINELLSGLEHDDEEVIIELTVLPKSTTGEAKTSSEAISHLGVDPIEGVLYIHSEQGGDPYFAIQRNWKNDAWSYDDLFGIETGDYLVVSSIVTGEEVWAGEIRGWVRCNHMKYPIGEKASWGRLFKLSEFTHTGKLYRKIRH